MICEYNIKYIHYDITLSKLFCVIENIWDTLNTLLKIIRKAHGFSEIMQIVTPISNIKLIIYNLKTISNWRRKFRMQIKVYDAENQKKNIRTAIWMLQKRLFHRFNCKIRLLALFIYFSFEKVWLENASTTSVTSIDGITDYKQIWIQVAPHNEVSRTLLESPKVSLQGCGFNSK